MAKSKTIDLIDPFVWHDKRVAQITIKEPTAGQAIRIGLPRIIVRNNDGAGYFVEQIDAIRAYLDLLLSVDGGSAILEVMSLADGMELKEALFGFFTDAEMARSAKKSTPSSLARE